MTESTPLWHANRRRIVGGSEVGALLSDDCFVTEWELFHIKKGTMPPKKLTPEMAWGVRLEPAVIQATCEDLGWNAVGWAQCGGHVLPVVPGVTRIDTERGQLLVHESGLGGTPDGLVDGAELLEIKTTTSWAMRDWPEDGEELPDGYLYQVLTYLGLLGLPRARVAVFVLDLRELRTFTVDAHPGAFARLCEEARRFWRRVAANDEPAFNPSRDAEAMGRRFKARSASGTVDRSRDAEFCALVREYQAARDTRLAAEKHESAKRALLQHRIGDAETVIAGPLTVSTSGGTLRVKEWRR